MKRIILTISLLTTSLCFANPSFDCQKAKTAAEKAICANTSLSDDDCQLGLYYQTLLAVNPANKTSLIQSQQQWLKKRNQTMQESADAGGSLYAERESQLAEQLRQALLKGPLRNIALGKQYQPNQFLADLNHCNFALCNAYKAYFLLPNDPNQAYQYLLQASQQWQDFMGRCTSLSAFHDSNTPSTLTEIKTAYPNQTSITAMIANINQGISADVDAQLGMPLLIIKHTPEALNNMDYRYAFIESGSSPQTYVDEALPAAPKLDALDQLIASKIGPLIEKLHEAGEIGSIYLDIDAVGANDRRKLLLAPQLIKSPTAATIAQVLEDGHQWFKTSDEYNNFVNKFNEAAAEISQYYQKTPELNSYAATAKDYLAKYVYNDLHSYDDYLN